MARRVAILFNERAGRGKATRLEAEVRPALERAGLQVDSISVGKGEASSDTDLLLVLGGDGTLHHTLPTAMSLDAPIYHAPLGTENLIPREFGYRSDPGSIVRAIEAWDVREVDVGMCAGTPFVIMASVGFDANVIHRVHAERAAKIRRTTYLLPILRELLHADTPPISIIADGKELVHQTPGVAILANCNQYAFQLNPAPDSSMTDGLLDLVFMPARHARELIAWALRARLRRHVKHPALIRARAQHLVLSADRDRIAYQMDGEAYTSGASEDSSVDKQGSDDHGLATLEISVQPRALKLLMPAMAR